jgi:hypothetical protein
MPKAIFIQTDGTIKEVTPNDKKCFSYEELKTFIGGIIQIVPMPSGKELVCHDEGKLIGLAENVEATKIWKKEYPIEKYPNNNDELIVGNVLITDPEFLEEDEE